MLYIGELVKKLDSAANKEERFSLLDKNMNAVLCSFLKLYVSNTSFGELASANIDLVYEDNPHGRTLSNFYREYRKLSSANLLSDMLPLDKRISVVTRTISLLHKDEAVLVLNWIKGDDYWPQSRQEVDEYLKLKGLVK